MTNSSGGGHTRFRGPGTQWKSSWKRKKLPLDRFDMPFFLRFVNNPEGDIGQWYEGQFAFPFGQPFTGGPGTWLGCAIQMSTGSPAQARSLMGYFTDSLINPGGWRLDIGADNKVVFSVGLGQNGGIMSVTGPAVLPDVTYVFICDVRQPSFGQTEINLWVPGPGGAAQLFATNSEFFSYNGFFFGTFRFGKVRPLDVGAHGLHMAGLSMGSLKDLPPDPTPSYTSFFRAVRDTLSIPSLPLNDRMAAAAVYPNVPDPYTTDQGGQLIIQGGLQPILNAKFPPNFPY